MVETSLSERDLEHVLAVRLLTDSNPGLQQLQRGPAGQVTALAADIWKQQHALGERGTTVTFQWVPGHARLEGNESADQLAGEAAAAEQPDGPIDFASARSAIERRIGKMDDARSRASHPHPAPTPGHNDLSRWEACTLSQLGTGTAPLTRDVVHRLGLAAVAACQRQPVLHAASRTARLACLRGARHTRLRVAAAEDSTRAWGKSSADRRQW